MEHEAEGPFAGQLKNAGNETNISLFSPSNWFGHLENDHVEKVNGCYDEPQLFLHQIYDSCDASLTAVEPHNPGIHPSAR